ncbi:hypothetical protein GOODEAATRI_030988 [Goodea atripinnis]|uniref:Uncharacterized protein n=1 Tax=Goodea atripinnis TaxID=208336 RepID=A0ABV0MWT5_9TELE
MSCERDEVSRMSRDHTQLTRVNCYTDSFEVTSCIASVINKVIIYCQVVIAFLTHIPTFNRVIMQENYVWPSFATVSKGGCVSTCFYVQGVAHECHSLEDKQTVHTPKHTCHNLSSAQTLSA